MTQILDWLFVSQLAIGIILCMLLLSLWLVGGLFYVVLGSFLSFWLYENTGVHSSPEKVTLAFIKAAIDLDSTAVNKLITTETATLFSPLWAMVSQVGEEEQQRLRAESANIRTARCQYSEDGASAQCTLCCDTNNADISQVIPTQRIGGKWYVHITKESMNQGNSTPPSENVTGVDTTTTQEE